MFVDKGNVREITSAHVRTQLRAAAASVGREKLGFHPDEIGCHFLRSGAAMAMKLAGVSEYTIMIIGRWKSMAFLEYIRKQVAEFSIDISDRLLDHAIFSRRLTPTHLYCQPPGFPKKLMVESTIGAPSRQLDWIRQHSWIHLWRTGVRPWMGLLGFSYQAKPLVYWVIKGKFYM